MAAQNLGRFPKKIDMRHHGLSDYDGTTDIYYAPAFGFAASSSIKTHDHNEQFETAVIHRASVELSDLESTTILKIDTEGHEYRILHDMADRLASVSSIFLEIHSDADRRSIDTLLGNSFVLFYSRCDMANRYKVAYVNKRELEIGKIGVTVAPELRP